MKQRHIFNWISLTISPELPGGWFISFYDGHKIIEYNDLGMFVDINLKRAGTFQVLGKSEGSARAGEESLARGKRGRGSRSVEAEETGHGHFILMKVSGLQNRS